MTVVFGFALARIVGRIGLRDIRDTFHCRKEPMACRLMTKYGRKSRRQQLARKPKVTQGRSKGGKRSAQPCPIDPTIIDRLGVYFDVCNYVMKEDEEFWFRGLAEITRYPVLVPSALRYTTSADRNKALGLLAEFKRYAEIKLSNPPGVDEQLKWVQFARHHGLPTRLLDWTRSAAIALYFACSRRHGVDGGVFILNPVNLNRQVDAKKPRVFDAHSDARLISQYLRLLGVKKSNGCRTIAIYPVWNSERIMLQQGVFTLAGSREFVLDVDQAPGLVCLRIQQEYKRTLLMELDRIGINEMSIFPEAEHTCNYLTWRAQLILERGD